MDPQHLTRLQEEQKKAITETDTKAHQIEQFKTDYKALQDRLKTLPEKHTHVITVPFGKMAFMPGHIVHTNEILVLLGDNWFVERSAKQAEDIVGRRIEELDKNLEKLKEQKKLLEPRLGFTSEMQAEREGHGDVKEIVEEYNEENEKLWDEQHRQNVRKFKDELKKNSSSTQMSSDLVKTRIEDSALWSRLDELEKIEEEKEEMYSVNDTMEDDIQSEEQSNLHMTQAAKRRVSWANEIQSSERNKNEEDEGSEEEYTDEEEESEEEYTDEEEESGITENARTKPALKTIHFSHTATPAILPHQVSASGDWGIHSPADIYKLFSPKSILKKSPDNGDVDFAVPSSTSQGKSGKMTFAGVGDDNHGIEAVPHKPVVSYPYNDNDHAVPVNAQRAFTGLVVEKPVSLLALKSISGSSSTTPAAETTQTTAQPSLTNSKETTKRISKFKAAKMKQNLS